MGRRRRNFQQQFPEKTVLQECPLRERKNFLCVYYVHTFLQGFLFHGSALCAPLSSSSAANQPRLGQRRRRRLQTIRHCSGHGRKLEPSGSKRLLGGVNDLFAVMLWIVYVAPDMTERRKRRRRRSDDSVVSSAACSPCLGIP